MRAGRCLLNLQSIEDGPVDSNSRDPQHSFLRALNSVLRPKRHKSSALQPLLLDHPKYLKMALSKEKWLIYILFFVPIFVLIPFPNLQDAEGNRKTSGKALLSQK